MVESSGAHGARNHGLSIVCPCGVVRLLGESDASWASEQTGRLRRKDFYMVRSFYGPQHGFGATASPLRARAGDCRPRVDRLFTLHDFACAFRRFAVGEPVKPLLAPDG